MNGRRPFATLGGSPYPVLPAEAPTGPLSVLPSLFTGPSPMLVQPDLLHQFQLDGSPADSPAVLSRVTGFPLSNESKVDAQFRF